MQTKLVPIGNSQGLRIPKGILQACNIVDKVELTVQDGRLVVEPARQPRQGWAEAAALMASRGEDTLLDEPTATEFDASDWEW
ncbi:MAG TPA: AbrB/MazE/SpoVT family DNA-binding domain-containing protein [Chloroflexota bacterium]|jgi:antitoxin MazE|nr:AbrB/MazE/SpoVT family DNA-binding domain-containing protein [Chloroflexota bacterium]